MYGRLAMAKLHKILSAFPHNLRIQGVPVYFSNLRADAITTSLTQYLI